MEGREGLTFTDSRAEGYARSHIHLQASFLARFVSFILKSVKNVSLFKLNQSGSRRTPTRAR